MKNLKQELWQSARTLILLGVLFTGASYVFAANTWTGPSGPPPTNNTDAPINVGDATQVKSGSLGVADFVADSVTVGGILHFAAITSPEFCIGTDCITSWPASGQGNYGCYQGTFGSGSSAFTNACSTPGCAPAIGLGTYSNGMFTGIINPGGAYGYLSCGSNAVCAKSYGTGQNYIWWGGYGGQGWVITTYAVGVTNLSSTLNLCQ